MRENKYCQQHRGLLDTFQSGQQSPLYSEIRHTSEKQYPMDDSLNLACHCPNTGTLKLLTASKWQIAINKLSYICANS